MDSSVIAATVAALVGAVGGGLGWLLRGRQRHISGETGALGLYGDALSLLENAHVALRNMEAARDEMERERDGVEQRMRRHVTETREALSACITARDEAKLERAKDRVIIAQLQEEVLKLQVRATAGEGRTSHLEDAEEAGDD